MLLPFRAFAWLQVSTMIGWAVLFVVRPFWMLSPIYLICTLFAQLVVIACHRYLKRLDNTWFLFDTLGLALFNIAGIQKSLECGFSFWVAIIMGCITGAAGEEPVIFRKEIYAMACVAGGLAYWGLSYLGVSLYITVIVAFCVVCAIRLLAVRYHISLPKLRDEEQTVE